MKIMDFSSANCKNCYKCVRNCHVKAIKIVNDQAEIMQDRCIACGQCFVVCPQNARNIVSDVDLVKQAKKSGKRLIASVAPSFAGIYKYPDRFFNNLKLLGFDIIEETAVGANIVTQLYKDYIVKNKPTNIITSCCPSITGLIEAYYPSLIPNLLPIESPMIIHSRLLKKRYGDEAFVVFIGPCISKKVEAFDYKKDNILNAVLTFDEINTWMLNDNLNCNDSISCGTSYKNNGVDYSIGRSYPSENGILDSLKPTLDKHSYTPLSVSGLESCKSLFESMANGEISNVCIEANSCIGGCIGGPAIPLNKDNIHTRKLQLLNYIKNQGVQNLGNTLNTDATLIDINIDNSKRTFVDKHEDKAIPTEKELQAILKTMGKYTLLDELNCGACGYNTCREKAIAVFEGMSHPEMCMPYMRSKAERVTNTIFANSPNIIFLLDSDLNIVEANPAAVNTFITDVSTIRGKSISYLINDEDFRQVKESKQNIIGKKVSYSQYNFVAIENILYIPDQNIYMAIFYNLTEQEKRNKELALLKQNTLETAQNIIQKQMRVAQEIASLLGETTAETKVTLLKLQQVVLGEEGDMK